MEPDGLLPCTKGTSTGLYPEPDQSSPYRPILSLRSILMLFFHLCLDLPCELFPSGIPIKILYVFLFSLKFWSLLLVFYEIMCHPSRLQS
jgi:hypothetical protein